MMYSATSVRVVSRERESNGLIDWVDAAGRLWGRVRRRIDLQHEKYPESVGARIQDGIPPDDFRDQKFMEVYEGDALRFRLALKALNENQWRHVYVHYVIPVGVKEKVFRMGRSKANYYQTLATAHRRMANLLEYGC